MLRSLRWGCQITNPGASMSGCHLSWPQVVMSRVERGTWSARSKSWVSGEESSSSSRDTGLGKSHTLAFAEFAGSSVRGKLGSATDRIFGFGRDGPIASKYPSNWVCAFAAALIGLEASNLVSSVGHVSSSSSDPDWGKSNLNGADICWVDRWPRCDVVTEIC